MTIKTEPCPIWGGDNLARVITFAHNAVLQVRDSPRAGGAYEMDQIFAEPQVKNLSDAEKARLTTWLIEQRYQGNEMPKVRQQVIADARNRNPLAVHQRADRLLRFIAGMTKRLGAPVSINQCTLGALAWTESTTWGEVDYLLDYLQGNRLIAGTRPVAADFHGTVTVAGYNRIADQQTNIDSSQAFIAMWFDDSMAGACEDGLEAGIEAAGYKPFRINLKEHINKIDDEIIAEVRRSRFLVADFTHGPTGARGSVYYEAGFAHGLGLPVIFTCRQDCLGKLHFDTSHYNHIVWADPGDLGEQLRNRILAVIGEGPEAHRNP